MQFVTFQFFLFFLGVFAGAILLKENKKYYRVFLLAASLAFYLFFGVNFFVILTLNIGVNYAFLKAIERFGKKALVLSVIANVLFLGAFKYYNFGTDALLQLLNALGVPADIGVIRILIPVGISFYTFRNISHLVDCYRRELPVPSFVDFANYVAFFPQIMSGPIVRAREFYAYLDNPGLFTYSPGRIVTLVLSGLVKKYVIASYLFSFATAPFASPSNYSSLDLVTGALAYSAMIFVDFSGYSDFAIALSNLLGFHVHRNFLSPYSAIGLKDFWNRWHISLSAWLRDYVYIPLGGSRKGKARKYLNIVLTMFVSGLWHGAGLTFIVWGLLHGIGSVVSHLVADFSARRAARRDEERNLMIFERYEVERLPFEAELSQNARGLFVDLDENEFNSELEAFFENMDAHLFGKDSKSTVFAGVANFFGWLVTFVYVTFAWIFFTSSNIGNALSFIGSIFVSTVAEHKVFSLRLLIVVAVVILFNFIGGRAFRGTIGFFDRLPLAARIPAVAAAVYLILQLGPETVPPFIYFSF
ncbi:MAG: MBOAT family protein [Acidobacteria bacterium]|nr:MBOAT family protein [Acidobacteriota bacterium]